MTDLNFNHNMATKDSTYGGLESQILIAMPSLEDKRFAKSVIFICAHDKNGAMGLVINKRVHDLSMSNLLSDLLIPYEDADRIDNMSVLNGGPVERQRGFLLHSGDFTSKESVIVGQNYAVTGTVDALKKAMQENGPSQHLFALGYAGWEAGQLEQELQENAWLVSEATPEFIFDTDYDSKWERALTNMGVNPLMLSGSAGSA